MPRSVFSLRADNGCVSVLRAVESEGALRVSELLFPCEYCSKAPRLYGRVEILVVL